MYFISLSRLILLGLAYLERRPPLLIAVLVHIQSVFQYLSYLLTEKFSR